MWTLICFVTAAGLAIAATADSNFDIVGESKCADACDPDFGVDLHLPFGAVGAARDLDCDDERFNTALRTVGVDRSSVIAATSQPVSGTLYVAHVEVEDLYCRVPIWFKIDDSYELVKRMFCCDDEPAANLMRC